MQKLSILVNIARFLQFLLKFRVCIPILNNVSEPLFISFIFCAFFIFIFFVYFVCYVYDFPPSMVVMYCFEDKDMGTVKVMECTFLAQLRGRGSWQLKWGSKGSGESLTQLQSRSK